MDGNNSYKTYPRATDPAFKEEMTIAAVTTNTVTVNVGASPLVNYTVTNATYDEQGGDLVLTIGNHNLFEGTAIRLADNSLTFTCTMDGNSAQKQYPRPGVDPFAGTSINIKEVSHDAYDIEGAVYVPSTGVMTLDVTGHPFQNGDKVRIADESIVFTCGLKC